MTWLYAPSDPAEVTIPFPRHVGRAFGALLDSLLPHCRRLPIRSVSCWALEEGASREPGARLLARGFEWGWQPHWMWLDLLKLRTDYPAPAGLRVEWIQDDAEWEGYEHRDLPYYSPNAPIYRQTARSHNRSVWRFGAWLDGEPVGHSTLHLTAGRLKVAGIFNVGVIPEACGQGVGKAVTAAACRFAREKGCRYAVLNSTGPGEPVYRRIGFETLGFGQTWWMHRPVLDAPSPSAGEVAFLEAVGLGDLDALNRMGNEMDTERLNAPALCGLTPLEIAVKTHQPQAAEWLVSHGAALDVISGWDLGWRDRVRQLLSQSPERASLLSGAWQVTPMHVAVERNDVELVRALLAAKPDLTIEDAQFHSTPLGWATHFQRTEIIELIREHQNRTGRS
jgi:GNAT superfamily N-acetyltransferase